MQNIKTKTYENLTTSIDLQDIENVRNIEDFRSHCDQQEVCAYFAARELKEVAEIIFCPYNYLINPSVRKSMRIDLKDKILIIDEAHNIENSCREEASCIIEKKNLMYQLF